MLAVPAYHCGALPQRRGDRASVPIDDPAVPPGSCASAAAHAASAGGATPQRETSDAIYHVWYIQPVIKTTIYLPAELHQGIKHAAKERGTSEAELIRTAVRHELLGAPADQQERAQRRARLLAAMGKLDSSAYPSGYLDELRAQWRG
jgi:hypothetical protein